MLATRNFRDWHTIIGEVTWSSVLKTTMDCHSELVLHSLRNNQPVQVVMHQRRQTTLTVAIDSDVLDKHIAELCVFCVYCVITYQYDNRLTEHTSDRPHTPVTGLSLSHRVMMLSLIHI